MPYVRGNELATVDVARITVKQYDTDNTLVFNTVSKVVSEPVIHKTDAIKLIIRGELKAQLPEINTVYGTTITLVDNVFNIQLIVVLQGGELEYDNFESDKLLSYTPPAIGSEVLQEMFELCTYSAIYTSAGVLTGYEKITYSNCFGSPITVPIENNIFRINEYTIHSMADIGEPPYKIEYIGIEELPPLPEEQGYTLVGLYDSNSKAFYDMSDAKVYVRTKIN